MDDKSRSDQEEFYARAITEYYGVATDELDMREGCIYTIIQTTENGWWYAVDFEHGIDGWVPSNYLEKVSEGESSELRAQQKKQEELESQKHAKLAAAGAYAIAPDEELEQFSDESNEEKPRASNAVLFELTKRANAFRERQDLQAQAAKGDQSALLKFKELEIERNARKLQKALNNPYKGRKEKIMKEMMLISDDEDDGPRRYKGNKGNSLNVKKRRKKSRRPTMLDELSAEDIKHLNSHRPQFETIKADDKLNVTTYNSKAIELWNVDELLHYLTVNSNSKNTLELKNVIGHLCNKAEYKESVRDEILSKNGLNILLNLIKYGENDIAISMSCCKVVEVLCSSELVHEHLAEKVSVFYLCTAVRNFYKQPIFCYTAFSCICNFVHKNNAHRNYVLNDKYNKVLLGYIIEGMNRFRYNDDDQYGHDLIEKVQISGCLALENFAATENGRVVIGTDGVEAVLDTFIAHMDNDNIIYATLRALINLCINEENARHFIQNGGLNYLLTYFGNPDEHEDDLEITNDIKITISRILRNISTEKKTAITLCEEDEILDVMTALLKDAKYGTELFYEVIQFINAVITTLDASEIGNKVMINIAKKGLFVVLIEALEIEDKTEYNSRIAVQCASIIYFYVKSKDEQVKQLIFNQASLYEAETFIPSALIQASIDVQSTKLTHFTILILFECVNIANIDYSVLVKKALIDVGILDSLLLNETWYQSKQMNDDVIALGISIILSYLQIWLIDHQQHYEQNCLQCDWNLNKYKENIENANKYIQQNRINDTESHHLKQTISNLDKICKIIPVLLKMYP